MLLFQRRDPSGPSSIRRGHCLSNYVIIIIIIIIICRDVGLTVNIGKTRYMEVGGHRGMMANAHIKIGSNSYEKVKPLNT